MKKERKIQEFKDIKEIIYDSADKYAQKIAEEGLKAMTRQYVHLSSNLETAIKVALRRKEIVIYKIYSHKMAIDGYEFFISENGVWLTKSVPVKYLERIDKKDINI